MPNCDFYAAGDDFSALLDFIFAQPGWLLGERYSVPDQPLRRFHSTSEVLEAYDLSNSHALLFLYTPELGGSITERRIELRPGSMGAAKGRWEAQGWGLIDFQLEEERDGHIALSHTNHNSEARARRWEPGGDINSWNWAEVTRTSRRLNHYIRRISVSRSGSRVILPEAATRVAAGALLAPN
jgi:hypothetical protein